MATGRHPGGGQAAAARKEEYRKMRSSHPGREQGEQQAAGKGCSLEL